MRKFIFNHILQMAALMAALSTVGPPSPVSADELFTIDVVQKFIKKRKACFASFARISEAHLALQKRTDVVEPSVWCIANVTADPGTIHEQRGCGLTFYDVVKGEYAAPVLQIINGQSCESGGAEKFNDQMSAFLLRSQHVQQIYAENNYAACCLARLKDRQKDCSSLRPKTLTQRVKSFFSSGK